MEKKNIIRFKKMKWIIKKRGNRKYHFWNDYKKNVNIKKKNLITVEIIKIGETIIIVRENFSIIIHIDHNYC